MSKSLKNVINVLESKDSAKQADVLQDFLVGQVSADLQLHHTVLYCIVTYREALCFVIE